jgi:phosphopantothenoylcysteine decarboxylase/phosphopantothenate--cysteine ligase
MNILLGVTGGIAAYKSCEFCSLAIKAGHQIQVIQTPNSQQFVGSITFEGLTGRKVLTSTFDSAMDHIQWAKWADVVLIAPLSANSLAKIAHGLCDDLLSTTIVATPQSTPILLCPAMNTHMWMHPMTQRNVNSIQDTQRFHWVMPVEKRLACGDVGIGGLAEPTLILQSCEELHQ